eukprot:scaffold147237_cov36-Tisochrysis_lutea.AAC.1
MRDVRGQAVDNKRAGPMHNALMDGKGSTFRRNCPKQKLSNVPIGCGTAGFPRVGPLVDRCSHTIHTARQGIIDASTSNASFICGGKSNFKRKLRKP